MVGGGALPTIAHMWKLADKFVELVFPFHLYVGREGVTQVAKLTLCLLCLLALLNHLGGPAVKRCFDKKAKHTKVW